MTEKISAKVGYDRSFGGSLYPVLHVDDNPNEHLLLRAAVEQGRVGLRIRGVSTTAEAMECLKAGSPAWERGLILLDFQLLAATSLDLICWIRSRPRLEGLPIVMYSSSENPRDILRCFECGADVFLQKPMYFERVKEILRAVWLFLDSRPIDLRLLTRLRENRSVTSAAVREQQGEFGR